MKEVDCVEVIVEKEKYAKEGIHRGMQGVIWEDALKNGYRVVLFPQYGDKEDIADLYIKEEDLRLLPDGMNAKINEQIKACFEDPEKAAKLLASKPDSLSDHMI